MLTADQVRAAAQQAKVEPNSIVIKQLAAPEPVDIRLDEDVYRYPASMIKTPLAVATFALVESGDLKLEDYFAVTESNMTANDLPSPLRPGYRASLHELIELMITRSDNVATNMLFDICGRERATHIVQERFGLTQTAFYRKLSGSEPLIVDPGWDRVHRNIHNAGDAAKLFELIANDGVPYPALMRETLFAQQFNDKLNGGLRPGDRFAHKTGDTDEVTHDGGILYLPDGPSYVIVVYTSLESSPQNNARFGPFMRAIRDAL
ncbi:MAG: serine hydrolase [Candidatus Eremiobacteraeota bacterium]|nr:serine hydrolase [Candidatus Eremiobacteraeota bacterium]